MEPQEQKSLLLEEIDRGMLVEQINEHLRLLVNDIADPSKKATKKRSVMISIEALPSESRREFKLRYSVDLKPSSHLDRDPTTIFMGRDEAGNPVAKPWVPNQRELFAENGAVHDDAQELADDAETSN